MANTNLFSATLLSSSRFKASLLLAGALLTPLLGHSLLGESAWAGPVVCTTTLEPPLLSGARSGVGASAGELGVASGPVEVTRCGQVQTPPALMEKRFYSFRAPYAPGVSLTNQITDLFGIALGGVDGTRVMGLGFPDKVGRCPGAPSMCLTVTQAALDQLAQPSQLQSSQARPSQVAAGKMGERAIGPRFGVFGSCGWTGV